MTSLIPPDSLKTDILAPFKRLCESHQLQFFVVLQSSLQPKNRFWTSSNQLHNLCGNLIFEFATYVNVLDASASAEMGRSSSPDEVIYDGSPVVEIRAKSECEDFVSSPIKNTSKTFEERAPTYSRANLHGSSCRNSEEVAVHPAKANVLDGRVEEFPLKLEVDDFDHSSASMLNDVDGPRLIFSQAQNDVQASKSSGYGGIDYEVIDFEDDDDVLLPEEGVEEGVAEEVWPVVEEVGQREDVKIECGLGNSGNDKASLTKVRLERGGIEKVGLLEGGFENNGREKGGVKEGKEDDGVMMEQSSKGRESESEEDMEQGCADMQEGDDMEEGDLEEGGADKEDYQDFVRSNKYLILTKSSMNILGGRSRRGQRGRRTHPSKHLLFVLPNEMEDEPNLSYLDDDIQLPLPTVDQQTLASAEQQKGPPADQQTSPSSEEQLVSSDDLQLAPSVDRQSLSSNGDFVDRQTSSSNNQQITTAASDFPSDHEVRTATIWRTHDFDQPLRSTTVQRLFSDKLYCARGYYVSDLEYSPLLEAIIKQRNPHCIFKPATMCRYECLNIHGYVKMNLNRHH